MDFYTGRKARTPLEKEGPHEGLEGVKMGNGCKGCGGSAAKTE